MPRKPPPTAKLSPQQERFVQEYLTCLNASKAAVRAGYSPKTAGRQGWDLLKHPEIARAVESARQRVAEKTKVELERLVLEAMRIALVDIGDAFDAAGNLLSITAMPEHVRRAIAGVDVVIKNVAAGDGATDTIHKVKFWDKGRALELAAKLSGLYVEKKEVGKPGQFRKLTDEELREKLAEAARVFGVGTQVM